MHKFDPLTVPTFPVLNLHLDEADTVTLDGRAVDVAEGQRAIDASLEAVAAFVHDHRLGAVRVRATTPDGVHEMVVTADGEAHETAPTTPPPSTSRRLIIASSVVAGVVVLALVAVAALWIANDRGETPVPTATSTVPAGAGANAPVKAPPGYGQKASWSLPIAVGSTPIQREDGTLVVVTPDDVIQVLAPDTGAVLWEGTDPLPQMHLTTVDDRPVLAAVTGEELHVWPLDVTEDAAAPTAVDLTARAEVSFDGSAPLMTLPNQTVAMLTADGVVRRDVPVGAKPVLATPDAVIATSDDAWWTITATEEPQKHGLPKPSSAEGAPRAVSAADDTHLVAIWATTDPQKDVVALIDLTAARVAAETTVSAGAITERDEPIREETGSTMTLGQVLIDYSSSPRLVELAGFTPSVLTGHTVYGLYDRQAARIDGRGSMTAEIYDDEPDATLPAVVSPDFAYLVTEKVDQTILYALPRANEGDVK